MRVSAVLIRIADDATNCATRFAKRGKKTFFRDHG